MRRTHEIIESLADARGLAQLAERQLHAAARAFAQSNDQLDLERLAEAARQYERAIALVEERKQALTEASLRRSVSCR